jgi:hypothetical protein
VVKAFTGYATGVVVQILWKFVNGNIRSGKISINKRKFGAENFKTLVELLP